MLQGQCSSQLLNMFHHSTPTFVQHYQPLYTVYIQVDWVHFLDMGFKNQWSTFGARLEYVWSTFGVLLGHCWSTFGALLEHFWSNVWSTFEALLEYSSLAHKSENVYNLSDILIRGHDVKTYFTGPHKILHFAGSGHRRILELRGGNLPSRDP